jgi:AsmA-like C-terminal region
LPRSGSSRAAGLPVTAAPTPAPGSDFLSGSLQLHHVEWKASYLARAVEFSQGTVNLIAGNVSSAPIASMTSDFGYGTLKGSMTVNVPIYCKTGDCRPQVQLRMGALDANDLEVALLGTPEKKSLLSPLMDRMRSSDRPKWPAVTVNVQADSLVLGPADLHKPQVRMRMEESEIVLESWEAGLLDGFAKGTGRCSWTDTGLKYALEGDFTKLSAASLGELLNGKRDDEDESGAATAGGWGGGPLSGSGSIQLSGLTGQQLAASATGSVRFDWPHGSISAPSADVAATAAPTAPPAAAQIPEVSQQETHFDDWIGTATVQGGKVQLADNAMRQGKRSVSVAGVIPFGGSAKLSIGPVGPIVPANGKAAGGHAAPGTAAPPAVQ